MKLACWRTEVPSVSRPPIFQIKVLVETDDLAELEALADAIGKVVCPAGASSGHACRIPWFVITSPVDKPKKWRDLLNR